MCHIKLGGQAVHLQQVHQAEWSECHIALSCLPLRLYAMYIHPPTGPSHTPTPTRAHRRTHTLLASDASRLVI